MGPNIEIPDAVAKAVMEAAGIDQADIDAGDFQLMAIELDALGLAGTSCGMIGNRPFTKKTLRILKDNGIDYIVAVVDSDLRICSMAATMLPEIAELLQDSVNLNSGSLNYLNGPESEWAVFESE